ncbi:MAG: response regulator [Syntrophobacteraceae bacterium]
MSAVRILVVEDEAIVAMEIEQRLAFMGYQSAGTSMSGDEAVALTGQLRPDLVLMDIRLQGDMDGIQAAGEILSRFRVPVIFLTAYSEDATLERAKLAEPYGYIIKPFNDRELRSSIEIALYKHAAEQEILRMNRLYDVLSQVSQAIVRVQTRDELFPTVCRLVVERGAMDLAWIGLLDAERSCLIPVASFGGHADTLVEMEVTSEGGLNGLCSPGRSIRDGNLFVCHECDDGRCLCQHEKSASPLGFRSCGSFPLRFQGQVCGVLTLCATKPGFFRDREVALLEEVALNISFALDKIEGDAQRLRMERSLRASEQRFRDILDATGEYIWETDPTGRLTFLSERIESILGYRAEEILGRRPSDLMEESAALELTATFEEKSRAKTGFRDLEHRALAKSGTPVWLSATGVPILDAAGELVGYRGTSQDITERKQAEQALRELHTELEQIFEAATPLCFIDMDHTLSRVNEGFCTLFALKREAVLGRLCHEVWQGPQCDHAGCMLSQVLAGAAECGYEVERELPDGRRITVLVMAQPFMDASGEVRGIIESFVDITERKRAEEEKIKLESQLRHAQKLEAIGTLAGGIAHDFNNILTPIIGYTEMALSGMPETSPLMYDLNQVLAAANRAKDLVSQILTFSRQSQDQLMRPTDLSVVLKEALRLLRASLPTTIEIRKNIHKGMILADATQIHQVIVNLCTNAAHAMNERGVLDVSLTQVRLSDQDLHALSFSVLKPGRYIKLSVSDTGHGMSRDIMEHIFDPYFTTKEVGGGTGLGLAVVHGIVKKHGGEISVRSTLGKGSVFEVYLPAVTADAVRTANPPLSLPRGTETILLVDDEPMIMDLGSRLLGQLGYTVKARNDPHEALALLLSNPREIDLVITDYTMPGLTGMDLSSRVLKARPGMPIILCTGFNERVTTEMARQAGITEILIKPFDKRRLAEVVRTVLNSGKP